MSTLISSHPRHDPLLNLWCMCLHHEVDAGLGALLDASEASLEHFLCQIVVTPAGMVGRHEDEGIMLVPGREVGVGFGLHRTEITRHEVNNPRYPVLALYFIVLVGTLDTELGGNIFGRLRTTVGEENLDT
ncbi:hypothetical protein RRF57_010703 [Xylaria bambusicola]|uniref:Uncharacterized protein n=1 Tax=Xylaria bambusicola TaxID=326684 RepID=A0AAN7UYI5_9PEZI